MTVNVQSFLSRPRYRRSSKSLCDYPIISDVNVAWDLAKGRTVDQIPSSLPALFSGDRLVVYGVLKASENTNEGDDNEVRLEGMLRNDEKVKHVVKFSTPHVTPPIAVEHKGNVHHNQLAAKSFIQDKKGYRPDIPYWKEDKALIVSISKSANVVSKFTSFVAVDKDINQPVLGPMRTHFVPLLLLDTKDVEGTFSTPVRRNKSAASTSPIIHSVLENLQRLRKQRSRSRSRSRPRPRPRSRLRSRSRLRTRPRLRPRPRLRTRSRPRSRRRTRSRSRSGSRSRSRAGSRPRSRPRPGPRSRSRSRPRTRSRPRSAA